MPYRDPARQRENARQHYAQNREAYKERAVAHSRRQATKLRKLIRAAKNVPCTDCGEGHPFCVMEFDHVRGRKEFNIGEAASRGFSVERVRSEIAKCEVVCANCHRKRTWSGRESASEEREEIVDEALATVLSTLF